MKRLSRKALVSGALAVGLMAVGIAFAAWTASGTGNGYAKATTAAALSSDDASASTTGQLYPGGEGDVVLTVRNPNPYPVLVKGIADNATITSSKGANCNGSTGVTFDDFTYDSATMTAATYTVPAKSAGVDGSKTITLANAANMSNASHNDCQGAVFTIPVSISGESAAS